MSKYDVDGNHSEIEYHYCRENNSGKETAFSSDPKFGGRFLESGPKIASGPKCGSGPKSKSGPKSSSGPKWGSGPK